VDPFAEIAATAAQHGAWLHVDGAYGAFAALTERGASALAGMELADSVTLDPHKWLYQPFECGALLVRDGRRLDEAFVIHPEYLKDVEAEPRLVNFADRSFQLTRVSRALKVWLSLKYFGVDRFRAAIDRTLDLARLTEQLVRDSAELELLAPTSLGVTCFRRHPAGVDDEDELAALNARLVQGLGESGLGLVSSTRLRGRYAIRLCVLNHTSTAADVERVVGWLERAELEPAAPLEAVLDPVRERHRDAAGARLERGRIDAAALGALPLFACLDDAQLERLAHSVRVTSAAAGEAIVHRWEAASDFYVIVEGAAQARRDDEVLGELAAGDFFGELAALEWGASFGYPRLASVVATAPLTAVVMSSDVLNALMQEAPPLAARVRRAAQERLQRV
jgi:hypothetical protein